MKRISTVLAWLAVALVAGLAALNWTTMTSLAPINLGVAVIDVPLGVALLGVAAGLAALFLIAYVAQHIGLTRETRKLLTEIQRVQGLADRAEASRIDKLQQLVSNEFRQLNQRLGAGAVTLPSAPGTPPAERQAA